MDKSIYHTRTSMRPVYDSSTLQLLTQPNPRPPPPHTMPSHTVVVFCGPVLDDGKGRSSRHLRLSKSLSSDGSKSKASQAASANSPQAKPPAVPHMLAPPTDLDCATPGALAAYWSRVVALADSGYLYPHTAGLLLSFAVGSEPMAFGASCVPPGTGFGTVCLV